MPLRVLVGTGKGRLANCRSATNRCSIRLSGSESPTANRKVEGGFMVSQVRLLLVAALFCASFTVAQEQAAQKTDASPKTAPPAVVVDADYKIGPQDVVRIDVWKEPDI